MERYKKKNMLQMVLALMEVNELLGKVIEADPSSSVDALAQCQESAIRLGTYLETFGSQYIGLVKNIEEYCENIYQVSIAYTDKKRCSKLCETIQNQLTSLQNSLQLNIPEDRNEVVFLPYKASMWDSLESVWKTMEADENTDAYVIPIPYFDKNPDGSMREEHYEGDLYPDYVRITKYNEYNFEERKPDLIFIHNPYDEYNYITSVHPFFYSKNLKQFTNQLVYIPYFILEEIKPDNQDAIDCMKHFCLLPGVINSDRVIVQSEDMRLIYINVLTEASGNTKEAREHWTKRIFGFGSPKIDKALSTQKEDVKLPDEWLKIIQKPDGTWKKIILYNTSISALLDSNEKMLEKMETVFGIFKEVKQEVALLWRPHPLLESTMVSMRPQLWNQYRAIRDEYICTGWGIYDDSPDMNRAVAVSDGYYGDNSSIVQLYRATGKPLMLQDVNIL